MATFGTAIGKGKKARLILDAKKIRQAQRMDKSMPGLREVFIHEKFHTKPIVGQSEIFAHFIGAAKATKKGFNVPRGIMRVKQFSKERPTRFKMEVGVASAIGSGTGITAFVTTMADKAEKKTAKKIKQIKKKISSSGQNKVIFRRVRGRIVPIKVK